jgi:hypothetical protein
MGGIEGARPTGMGGGALRGAGGGCERPWPGIAAVGMRGGGCMPIPLWMPPPRGGGGAGSPPLRAGGGGRPTPLWLRAGIPRDCGGGGMGGGGALGAFP